MKKVLLTFMSLLLVFSLIGCQKKDDPGKDDPAVDIKCSELLDKFKKAIGEDNWYADTEMEKSELLLRIGVDEKVVKDCVAYESSLSFLYIDMIYIVRADKSEHETIISNYNALVEAANGYVSQYNGNVSKVNSARIYEYGEYVVLVMCGYENPDDTTGEAQAKTAEAEYAKIDAVWKEVFGKDGSNLNKLAK